jgi:hypothetical protein
MDPFVKVNNGLNYSKWYKALQSIYPEHATVWKDIKPKNKKWADVKNQRALLDQLAVKWNIKKPEDWLGVTRKMVSEEHAHFIQSYYNGSLLQGKL